MNRTVWLTALLIATAQAPHSARRATNSVPDLFAQLPGFTGDDTRWTRVTIDCLSFNDYFKIGIFRSLGARR
jgi:hypothetical protein